MSNYKKYHMADVHKSANQHRFTVIDTFSGGGGSSLGHHLAGGKELLVNEFVESARDTFSTNFPNIPILPDDIKELSGNDFLKIANIKPRELDIFSGSPPCSLFSMAGSISSQGKYSFGKVKNYSDNKKQENIEDLFFEFLRIANDIKPKVILAENVDGLLKGEAKNYFNKINIAFENIGYLVSAKVLNSADYGVPQTRKRLFFIGVREDVADELGYLAGPQIEKIFPVVPRGR